MPKGNPEGYSKSPRKRAAAAKKKIPAKNTIKKFDFTGTGRGPLMVPRRITGGPVRRTRRKK